MLSSILQKVDHYSIIYVEPTKVICVDLPFQLLRSKTYHTNTPVTQTQILTHTCVYLVNAVGGMSRSTKRDLFPSQTRTWSISTIS